MSSVQTAVKENEPKNIVKVLLVLMLIALTGTAMADDRNPNSSIAGSKILTHSYGVMPQTDMIKAVVVRSWNECNSASVWDDLNANWTNYGYTPIFIDYAFPGLCHGSITYANLTASRADVVIISDPSGGGQQYTTDEINAIHQYAINGHNVIGTYLLFRWLSTDNRDLASIFGLRSDINYTVMPFINQYNILELSNPLFKNIGEVYNSQGYPNAQVPINLSWNVSDLNGARYVAQGKDNNSVITVYDTSNYSAIYIANMPEYAGGEEDKQFLYNAIVYKALTIFDTGMGSYPSIMGTHNGTIVLNHNLTVHSLYTYPSSGTGGHSEYASFYYPNGSLVANGSWSGYQGDWHNITFIPFTLESGITYNYTIITGSYPQIIHNSSYSNLAGTITNSEFIDANGRHYTGWIPAIRLE